MVHTTEYKNCSTRLICVLNARLVIAFYRETNFEEISGINTKNVLLYIILYIFKNDGLYCMVSCVYVIFQKRETKLNDKHLLDKLTNRRVKEGTKEIVKLYCILQTFIKIREKDSTCVNECSVAIKT